MVLFYNIIAYSWNFRQRINLHWIALKFKILMTSCPTPQQMLLFPNATNDWTKSRFFTRTSGKSEKLFTWKILSGASCMKPACPIITSICWSHRMTSSFVSRAYCMTESCKQLCWFLGCSVGKKKSGFSSVVGGVWN